MYSALERLGSARKTKGRIPRYPRLPRPDFAGFKQHPEFQKLLDGWGERDGDTAVIAENGGTPVGAAWYRFWSPDVHSYGFVDVVTPEVAIGVDPNYCGQGVGRALMNSLIETARAAGVSGLSLSVDRDNVALKLYLSLGFRQVGSAGSSVTLLLDH